jgi:hypothetical protein
MYTRRIARTARLFAALAVFASVLATSLFGYGTAASTANAATTTAQAVNFNSWPKDVIYVYDTTAKIKKSDGSPVWPVKAAAARWSAGNPVDFRYTTTGCPKNSQCVIIKQSELAAPTVGVTSIARVGTDIKSVTIVLDTTFGRTNSAARRRNVACHELGHSLGLQHRTGTSSCLTPYVTTTKYPDATDIRNLKVMYGYR